MRTVMGTTLAYLMEHCKVNSDQLEYLSPGLVKRSLQYSCCPENEEWRIQLALELRDIRDGQNILTGFSRIEVEEMLAFLCIS